MAMGVMAWLYAWPYFARSTPSEPPVAVTAPSQPQQPAAPEPAPTPSREPVKPVRPKAAEPKVVEPKAAEATAAEPKAAEPKPEPPPAATAPVVAAADVTSPDVLQPVVPDLSAKARASIHGKVPIVVRVQADASGAVSSAKVESGGSSKYFADLALKAAKQWKFVPGEDGRAWMLRFEFSHDAEHPVAARVILAP